MNLKELDDIAFAAKDPEQAFEAARIGIQALLFHQTIFEDTHGLPRAAFNMLKENQEFFQSYFSAAGFTFTVANNVQMISIRPNDAAPGYANRQRKLKKEDTLLRLALRYLYDRGMTSSQMDQSGRVMITSGDLTDSFRQLTGTEPPSETQLIEGPLRELHRKGAVRIGERDKAARVSEIMILPGITVLVSDTTLNQINDWLTQGAVEPFLEHSPSAPDTTTDEDQDV